MPALRKQTAPVFSVRQKDLEPIFQIYQGRLAHKFMDRGALFSGDYSETVE